MTLTSRLAALLFTLILGLAACEPAPEAPTEQVDAESDAVSAPQSAPSDEDAGESASMGLEIPRLAYRTRTLDNGLRVYAMRDPNTANVSVQVWYDVGSKDDPKGRSGFAHLFEHMMFKSTRNMPDEFFDRLTEDVGGFNNASTYDDFTNYYEVVPANHLERILWAEAERMGSLVVDEAVFASERDVVKEELRQGILASPYGRLFGLYLAQANFDVHPYGRPGIGSIEDLDAATVDEIRTFHSIYYRPDNAVLVVAGNFEDADLDRWVDAYFGPIARPDGEIPRVEAVEPERTEPKNLNAYAPNVPLPAVTMSWPGPAASNEDMAALLVLDAILANGESSRLYQSLVYEQQIAANVFTSYEPTQDPSPFTAAMILSAGKGVDEAIAAMEAEIERLRSEPVSAGELDEAKNEIVMQTLRGRETAFGRAFDLAESVIRYGDADAADDLVAAIQAVDAPALQDLAGRLFDDQRRVTIRYLNESLEEDGAPGDTIATPATIVARPLETPAEDITVVELAPDEERLSPPEPATPVSAQIPDVSSTTLENGLKVLVATNPSLPLISATLRFASGSSADPDDLAGLADLTAELTTKGTDTRSATQIARDIESLGASLSAGASDDSSSVSVRSRADRIDDVFAIMADVTRNPVFAEEELTRARQQALDGLSVALRQPSAIASRAMTRAVFKDHPYGAVASERSLTALNPESAAAFHAAHWRADNGVLVIVGDISADDAVALAYRHFGDWTSQSAQDSGADTGDVEQPARRIVIDLPGTGQAAVSFGSLGPARGEEAYFPTLLATNVLGGGYSARLNAEIRIKRGLSYGARTGFPQRLERPLIVSSAQTRNDAAVEVARLMEEEFAKLRTEPVPEAELLARKAVLIGGFGRSVETTSGLAGEISTLALFDLPPERLATYVDEIRAITPEQVRAAAEAFLDPQSATMVVVGDAAQFYDGLKERYPDAERIQIDDLNLDTASLK